MNQGKEKFIRQFHPIFDHDKFEEFRQAELAKYPEELRLATVYRPEESLDEYRARLRELYPNPEQRAYLDGLWATTIAGPIGIRVAFNYIADNDQPIPVTDYFPSGDNKHLRFVDFQLPGSADSIRIQLSNQRKNELMSACQSAAYYTKLYAKIQLEPDLTEAVARLAPILKPGNVQHYIAKVLATLREKKIPQGWEIIDKSELAEIHKFVFTLLVTENSAGEFRKVAKLINELYNPRLAALSYMFNITALDVLHICPDTSIHLYQAIAKHFLLLTDDDISDNSE